MTSPYPKPAPTPRPAKLHASAASWLGLVVGLCLGVALSWLTPANAARNGSGTYSLPNTGSVPNPVVTGTTITSTWANGTLSDISTEITNSLDRGGRGAMTAPLQLASGSVTAPGLTFSGDTNTGLYRVGADDMALVTAGTNRLDIASTSMTATLPTTITSSSVANSTALSATGYGSGSGVIGTGGSSSGAYGVKGIAGSGGSGGGYFNGSASGSTGVYVYAHASGMGLYVAAGTSSDGGTGGIGASISAGGSTGGIGGLGMLVQGGTASSVANSGTGIHVYAGEPSTGTERSTAIKAQFGDVDMNDVANVTSTTTIKNRLTPSNIPKAWGFIQTAAGTPAVAAGFNVSSVSCGSNVVTVTMAQAFSSSNFACVVTPSTAAGYACAALPGSTSTVLVSCYDFTTTIRNLCAVSIELNVVCFGNQ